jgi:hypothetical protein
MSESRMDGPADHVDPPVAEPKARVAVSVATPPGLLARRMAGQPLRRWLLLAGAGALAVWGAWATKALVDLSRERQPIVQVRLSEIVGDYVRDAARSSLPADEVSRQTARFLKVLNDVMGAQGSGGRIVLLSNAVVSGELPDITSEVRAQVYARVTRPIPATGSPTMTASPAAGDVAGQMHQFMGGEQAPVAAGGDSAARP